LARVDAPGDRRADRSGIENLHIVVRCIRIGGNLLPLDDGGVPILTLGAVGSAAEVSKGLFVRVHVSGSGAALDRHVADGHSLFQGKAFDGRTGILVGETGAAIDPEGADDVEDDVLGVDTRAEFSSNLDFTDLERGKSHRLGGEDIADLAGADPEGDRSESPVGGGVGIAAGNGGAGLGDALFRADDVDDALFSRGDVEEGDAEVGTILAEFLDHGVRQSVLKGLHPLVGGHDVVDRGKGPPRESHLQAQIAEHAEGLGAGDLVDQMGADKNLGRAIRQLAHGMPLPNFLKKRLTHKNL